ncbi:ATP-binding protein [Nocardioides sp.]|uniref:sensor histidine kinase n=1 Tax=Nocardioides sp. TaxID=35761 RepID=UPI00261942C3|nr:ATP-binding protein [Nocardioides sp.]
MPTRSHFESVQLNHRARAVPIGDERARAEVHDTLDDLAGLVGFRVAALSVVRDDGFLQVAVAVGTPLNDDDIDRMAVPPEVWPNLFSNGEIHGRWHLIRGAQGTPVAPEYAWVPDIPEDPDPQAWHPLDTLNYPVRHDGGDIVAVLSVDVPVSGRVPVGPEWVRLDELGRFASRTILAVLERERQAERARLAEAARTVLRRASGELPPAEALSRARRSIEIGLSADVVRYHLFEDWDRTGEESLISLGEDALIAAWQAGGAPVELTAADPDSLRAATRSDLGAVQAQRLLEEMGALNAMLVPVGAGAECYGGLTVARTTQRSPWSEIEARAVADIARDLGRSIAAFRTQEREHQLVIDLQRIADYKSRLVATVSHDLVSPISAIRLHLDMLEQTGADAELVPHAVQVMKRATQELLYSVEGLLALYRADAARMPRERVDLTTLLRYAVDVHRPLAEQAGLALIDESHGAEPTMIAGNRAELGRVLANLIGNAVKYTVSGSVKVAVLREEGWAVFSCRDTGVGMSPEDQERIFEEFFRSADPQVRNLPGTGLGMAIVARIVEAHGGTVTIDSEPGRGTRVQVRLPLG